MLAWCGLMGEQELISGVAKRDFGQGGVASVSECLSSVPQTSFSLYRSRRAFCRPLYVQKAVIYQKEVLGKHNKTLPCTRLLAVLLLDDRAHWGVVRGAIGAERG